MILMSGDQGTPTYIARAVCAGRPIIKSYTFDWPKMPRLKDECKELYERAYQGRYDQYADSLGKCHGGSPPKWKWYEAKQNDIPAFYHRSEHDVESIYWTMVATLLLVRPKLAPREEYASPRSCETWESLTQHQILDDPAGRQDTRQDILNYDPSEWQQRFPEIMSEVAILLHDISRQVAPAYDLVDKIPNDDHLHEAVQRLILQYLYDHRMEDIDLDQENHRPVQPKPTEKARKNDYTQPTATAETSGVTGDGVTDTGKAKKKFGKMLGQHQRIGSQPNASGSGNAGSSDVRLNANNKRMSESQVDSQSKRARFNQ